MITNPNWQEATSWPFTKRGRVESGTTGNKFKPEVRTGFEPGATAYKPNAPLTVLAHSLDLLYCMNPFLFYVVVRLVLSK